MNLKDVTDELIKVIAFYGATINLLGIIANDFQLLLVKPNTTQNIIDNIVNFEFFFHLSIQMNNFKGKITENIIYKRFWGPFQNLVCYFDNIFILFMKIDCINYITWSNSFTLKTTICKE